VIDGLPAYNLNTADISNQILFLTLKVFSATGGIEKVCRIAGKALYEHSLEHNVPVKVMSMHDHAHDATGNQYFPSEIFKGYNAAKSRFILAAVNEGRKSKTVIISHINLLPAGWLIKKLSPKTKVIILGHGIEIWDPLPPFKRKMLATCDKIVSVSSFTCKRIIEKQGIAPEKCFVLNNCIDPFLHLPEEKKKDQKLMTRYGFEPTDKILLTLTRLSEKDRYKGYDYVMESMVKLIADNPTIKYLLAGKYDAEEKKYIDRMVHAFGLSQHVVLTGFVPDEELPGHFSLADIYVMPSVKEGFGIVFVEAMYYGIPAIAGNADGSADALLNGHLGLLIKADAPAEIGEAIEKMLESPDQYAPDHDLVMRHFGYDNYKVKLEKLLM
jgi:phosphatidylinositol alpha-1,6-mannosyltransferase